MIIHDLLQDPRVKLHQPDILANGLSSYLGVPLVSHNETLGILHILSRQPRIFVPEDVEFFRIMAGQVAIAIDNAILLESLVQRESELQQRVVELRQATASLEEKQTLLLEAQKIARLADWVLEVEDGRLHVSKELEGLFGLEPGEFGGTYEAAFEYIHPEDREAVEKAGKDALRGRRPFDVENRVILRDGSQRTVRLRARVIFDDERQPVRVIGTIQDITETKDLERAVMLQEKLASLGHMAAGMAHEIRNPLSGINILLDAAEENFQDPDRADEVKDMLAAAKTATGKIEALIRRMLRFARTDKPRMEMLDVTELIQETVKLSEASLRKSGIELELDLARHVSVIYGERQLMEQVLLNLILNAREALSGVEGVKRISISARGTRNAILLKVADSGPGVPVELRGKIFEPFFSTKASGSGIGLSLSQKIILDHGGRIDVSPAELGGAEFTVRLPIIRKPFQATGRSVT